MNVRENVAFMSLILVVFSKKTLIKDIFFVQHFRSSLKKLSKTPILPIEVPTLCCCPTMLYGVIIWYRAYEIPSYCKIAAHFTDKIIIFGFR